MIWKLQKNEMIEIFLQNMRYGKSLIARVWRLAPRFVWSICKNVVEDILNTRVHNPSAYFIFVLPSRCGYELYKSIYNIGVVWRTIDGGQLLNYIKRIRNHYSGM